MKRPILISLIAVILSLILQSCDHDDDLSSGPMPIKTSAELDLALAEIYDASDAPGFAISIIKNNSVIFQNSFGMADIENSRPYTDRTIQPIGSISKTFVAAAIVKAIEQGLFTLETNINDILSFKVINPNHPDKFIKVKHLVTHTSGLVDNAEAYFTAYHILPGEDLSTTGGQLLKNGFGMEQRKSLSLKSFLTSYYQSTGDLYSSNNFSFAAPGVDWNYSNIATSLAAYLIEEATGMPFKAYVDTYIFQPLGMSNTAYDRVDLDATDLATLYWDVRTPLPTYANDSYPDGSIITCNEDLARYLIDMLKGAIGESSTLFSSQGYEMLFKAMLPSNYIPSGYAENQGIFWFLDGLTIKHDGSDPGTTCELQFDIADNSGYLLMTNMDGITDEHEMAYIALAEKVRPAISDFIQHN